ncbi:MAG TPA: hypothetical protein VN086_01345 [Candidatus Paceibacterota bacterium]|nr:hypothetical protein [Candidatus Paceibacterota bacterium]
MWPFRKHSSSSMVLITIGSSACSGAYVEYKTGDQPTIHYNTRHVIESRDGEDLKTAMLRTLDMVGTDLIEIGAPTLRRETGSGSVDGVLISIAGPWQETKVRTETVQPGTPFTFTRHMLSEIVASHANVSENRVSFGESVIATILNGYDIADPFGKKANRAEVVILSSSLDKDVTEQIRNRIRKLYHTHSISFTAFAPVTYAVLRDLYPHERDFLVLDVATEDTDLAFVKAGLLVDVGTLQFGLNKLLDATHAAERMTVEEENGAQPATSSQPGYINPDRNARFSERAETARDEWLKSLADLLKHFAQLHALPRTLFVVAQPNARDYLKRTLDSSILHELWLSDEPLSVIPITSEQFTGRLRTKAHAETPIFLSILALYQKKLLGK